jgi:hypothetical protein
MEINGIEGKKKGRDTCSLPRDGSVYASNWKRGVYSFPSGVFLRVPSFFFVCFLICSHKKKMSDNNISGNNQVPFAKTPNTIRLN